MAGFNNESSSESFWENPLPDFRPNSLSSYSTKGTNSSIRELSETFIDSHNYHDPFSPISLFLSKKIRAFIIENSDSDKWSLKLQDKLIFYLSVDFQKQFPKQRMSIAVVRKVFEKVSFYLKQVQQQKESLNEDGTVNVDFLLSENIKQTLILNTSLPAHPYYFAHQVAMQLAECVAILEGRKLPVDKLAKKVWHIQKHLLNSHKHQKSPYSELSKIDKLIIKTVLEITAKEPLISFLELKDKTQDEINTLKELPRFASLESIQNTIAAILSEKKCCNSKLYRELSEEGKKACESFIKKHNDLLNESHPTLNREDKQRRLLSLYKLAAQLPKNLDAESLKTAVLSCYPHGQRHKPVLPQQVYAFIAAEIVLMKNEVFCHSQEIVMKFIEEAYKAASALPHITSDLCEDLEMFISKWISDEEKTLEKLPYKIGQRIELEIANVIIDNPKASFNELIHNATLFFKALIELYQASDSKDISEKIEEWSLQSDLLLKYISIDKEASLLNEIRVYLENHQKGERISSHSCVVCDVCQRYLQKHPELSNYSSQLLGRIWTLYKYLFYHLRENSEHSSFELFLNWHEIHLLSLCQDLTEEQLEKQLIGICQKRLPSIPSSFVIDWFKLRLTKC